MVGGVVIYCIFSAAAAKRKQTVVTLHTLQTKNKTSAQLALADTGRAAECSSSSTPPNQPNVDHVSLLAQ